MRGLRHRSYPQRRAGRASIALVEGYGFDPSWSDERRRLALIERCYDPITTSRLTQVGVAAGWRCLDVGVGGGSIARWLRDQVGPDGDVVAIDLDTRFFEDEPGIEARRCDILVDEIEIVQKIISVGYRPYWGQTSVDGNYCLVSNSDDNDVWMVQYTPAMAVTHVNVGAFRSGRIAVVPDAVLSNPSPPSPGVG
jgi:hypothetical protein